VSRSKVLGASLVLGLLLGLFAEPALSQCSMCRAVVVQSPEGQRVAGELNKAILLMLVAPYLVMGGFTAWLFRTRLGALLRRAAGLPVLPR
jgi:hypothetical protein